MSNEATLQISLQINQAVGGLINYRSYPTAFVADVAGARGPTPGAIEVATSGTSVDLTQLSALGGFCKFTNQDKTNYVTVGIWDAVTSKFYPLLELLPGEFYVVRLSRFLQEEFGVGTGTSSSGTPALRLRAHTAACNVLVEAFDP